MLTLDKVILFLVVFSAVTIGNVYSQDSSIAVVKDVTGSFQMSNGMYGGV